MIKLFLALNVFGENLLKNANREDATFEILTMLLGAFALGFLLRHLIGFRKKEYIIEQNVNTTANDTTSDLAEQIERLRLEVNRLTGKSDDFSNESVIKNTAKGSNKQKPKQETTTLGDISALATLKSAEVKTLGDVVSYKTENDKSGNPSAKKKIDTVDDLKVIEGIGPALEKWLNENQIFSYDQLANKKVSELEEILEKGGPRFRVHVPETWPEQASLLRDGKTDAFKALTERLKGGRRV